MKICIKCVFLTMLLLIICSCRQQKQRIINLSIQRDTLQAINQRQETQLQELQSYVETMTMSLDSIAIEEGMLFLPDPEKPNSPLSKKQLKVRLQRFEELVDRQHAKIKELEDSLDMSNATLSNMKSLISYFRATLEQKEVEIEDMKKTLLQKNESIKKLTKEVKTLKDDVTNLEETTEQQQVIMDVQDEILNEGYCQVSERTCSNGNTFR